MTQSRLQCEAWLSSFTTMSGLCCAACRLMRLVFLSDEEIRGLQTASCWALAHHRLSRAFLCQLSVEERLDIKRHLLRQDEQVPASRQLFCVATV